eukprot:582123_1
MCRMSSFSSKPLYLDTDPLLIDHTSVAAECFALHPGIEVETTASGIMVMVFVTAGAICDITVAAGFVIPHVAMLVVLPTALNTVPGQSKQTLPTNAPYAYTRRWHRGQL